MDPNKAAAAPAHADVPPPPAYTQTPPGGTSVAIRLLGRDTPYLLPRAFYEKKRKDISGRLAAAIDAGADVHLFQPQFEQLLMATPTTQLQKLAGHLHDGFTDIGEVARDFRSESCEQISIGQANHFLDLMVKNRPDDADQYLKQVIAECHFTDREGAYCLILDKLGRSIWRSAH